MKNSSPQRGFSLVEMLIVIGIVAIMATIAVPSLASFVNQTRLNSMRNLLTNDINTARSEAIKSNVRVAICAANNAHSDCSGNADWDINGWIVCPASGAACNTAASAIVVRQSVVGITLAASTVNPIIFTPSGSATALQAIALTGKTGSQPGTLSVAATGFVSYKKN